jgi:hypothetical protein
MVSSPQEPTKIKVLSSVPQTESVKHLTDIIVAAVKELI